MPDKFEELDWFIIQIEDGETYVFSHFEAANERKKWLEEEFNTCIEILGGMDGQSIK